MPQFLVTWKIDIEAPNEWEAAEEAHKIQQEPGSEAVYFTVMDRHTKVKKDIDLLIAQEV